MFIGVSLRTAPLWVITQRGVVIPFWHSGPMVCPVTSVRNCHYSLRKGLRRAQFSSTAWWKPEIKHGKYSLMFWGYCTALKHQYLTSCDSLMSQKIWIFDTTVRTSNLSPLHKLPAFFRTDFFFFSCFFKGCFWNAVPPTAISWCISSTSSSYSSA